MAAIAMSVLSADFARLGEALSLAEAAGCSMLHVQVMDGHFVPDVSVGQPVIESLRKAWPLHLSIELLVERPERFVEDMAKVGADRLAIHAEATPDAHRALRQVRATGCKAGLALNPGTSIEAVGPLLPCADYLVILTADAGLGEEKFIEGMADRVSSARKEAVRRGLPLEIVAAGGIGPAELDPLVNAGADILVVGSAIFNNHDPESVLEEMMRRVRRAQGESAGGMTTSHVAEHPVAGSSRTT